MPTDIVQTNHDIITLTVPAFDRIKGGIDGFTDIEFVDKCFIRIYCRHLAIYNNPDERTTPKNRGEGSLTEPYVSLRDALVKASCYLRTTCLSVNVLIMPDSDPVVFQDYHSSTLNNDKLWIGDPYGGMFKAIGGIWHVPSATICGMDYTAMVGPDYTMSEFYEKDLSCANGCILYNCYIKNIHRLHCDMVIKSEIKARAYRNPQSPIYMGWDGCNVICDLIYKSTLNLTLMNMLTIDKAFGSTITVEWLPGEQYGSNDAIYDYIYSRTVLYNCTINGCIVSGDIGAGIEDHMSTQLREFNYIVGCNINNCYGLDYGSGLIKDSNVTCTARQLLSFYGYIMPTLSAGIIDNVTVDYNFVVIPRPGYGSPSGMGFSAVHIPHGGVAHNCNVTLNVKFKQYRNESYAGAVILCDISEHNPESTVANDQGKCVQNCRVVTYRFGDAPAPDVSGLSCNAIYA